MSRPGGKIIRCAIYTRKSTEEGLEQDFNSLDAQHEACTAYILSQKAEGWKALPDHYDDGGLSGGSMERPALQRLLADVAAHHVDVVVVYKVDRLTRALTDFAKIVGIFDEAGVSFVSVTQAFNTTTSMGRLTLNVLLSFAQFEREVTAERIRDKIAASKRKGMWMGGMVPIGYRAVERNLVPHPDEAERVQLIYRRYLELGSVNLLKAELDAAGARTPEHRYRGRIVGGTLFARGKLYRMLSNPLYVGRVRHKADVHPGQHAAIVGQELWQAVQDRLASNASATKMRCHAKSPSPLVGRLVGPDGQKMRPSHATRSGRRYRYYVSAGLIEGSIATGARGWRIPAAEIEAVIAMAIASRVREPTLLSELLGTGEAALSDPRRLADALGKIARQLDAPTSQIARQLLAVIVQHARVSETEVQADVRFVGLRDVGSMGAADAELLADIGFTVVAPIRMARRGAELRLILQGAAAPARHPDPHLVREVIAARVRVADYITSGGALSVGALAERDAIHVGDASRSLQLAFLAPDLLKRILDGDQPVGLNAERLKRIGELPLLWSEQRELFI